MSRRNEDFDESCDPDNPKVIKYDDVVNAAQKIKPYIVRTPCLAAHTQRDFGIYVHYKLEFCQKTGSFKERGALYALLQLPNNKKKIGIVVASTGNEALAFSHWGSKFNIPINIVFPTVVPHSILQRCLTSGAKVQLQGINMSETEKYARKYAKDNGLTYINGRDHPHVLAGIGTVALEILEQAPFADAVIVPVGSGGLIGVTAAVIKQKKPSCLIYGVQAEAIPSYFKSLEKQEPVNNLPIEDTLAGRGMHINSIAVNAFATGKSLIDKMILVKENMIAKAMLHLVEREKFVVEGAGACTLATVMENLVPEFKTKNVVCILTGGNVSTLLFNRSMHKGLTAEGRLIKFKVGVLNLPGQKRDLMRLISNEGCNVVNHFVDNIWVDGDTCYSEIRMVVETRGTEHALNLKRTLEKAYPHTVEFLSEPFNESRTCPCYIKK